MSKKIIFIMAILFIISGFSLYAQRSTPTSGDCDKREECSPPGIPDPTALNPPTYNYWEANSCTSCHFLDNGVDDFQLEAVGVNFDDKAQTFSFTGSGWYASRHSQSNHLSTQNTFCAKCHSPMQAKPQATFNNGFLENTELIPNGVVEGVTCSSCHSPLDSVSEQIGSHVSIYRFGDVADPASFIPIMEGQADQLCLNCHVNRHNQDSPVFQKMYSAGVECIDCHMAPYGTMVASSDAIVIKRAHDFKVAKNLPYSCGVQGSLDGFTCHGEFSTNATLAFLPFLKEQHKDWWPLNPSAGKRASTTATRSLQTAADYMDLWKEIQNQTVRVQAGKDQIESKRMAQ
ncbi:MAG: multiheme c-type cytochrome [Terriglobia bacterium]